jgi:hypothetical protein
MVRFVRLCFGMLVRLFRRRQSLLLENLSLRQQLVMLNRRRLISRVRRQVPLAPGRFSGRKQTPKEIRELIFQMVAENPTWGAPRIHRELRMLGFDLSERTNSRWMKRAPRGPDQAKCWLAFLRNHRESDCRHGFLHFANDHVRRALLLLPHQPRSSTHPAHQRHEASDARLDHPAAARGIMKRLANT